MRMFIKEKGYINSELIAAAASERLVDIILNPLKGKLHEEVKEDQEPIHVALTDRNSIITQSTYSKKAEVSKSK